jgi:hypothetical protein
MLICMDKERTTLVIPKPLINEVRDLSKIKNMSLSDIITLLISEGLRSVKKIKASKYKFTPTIIQGKVAPEVNIANRDEIFNLFDKK